MAQITADFRDKHFHENEGAVMVTGYYGSDWFADWTGIGPSSSEFSMKAILRDGIVYHPHYLYALRTPKAERTWEAYPLVACRVQPPTRCIVEVTTPLR